MPPRGKRKLLSASSAKEEEEEDEENVVVTKQNEQQQQKTMYPEASEKYYPPEAFFPCECCTWRSHTPHLKIICRNCYRLLDVNCHFHRPKEMPKSKDSYTNKNLLDLDTAFCSLHCIDSYVDKSVNYQPKRYHRAMNKLMAWQRHKLNTYIFPIVDSWAHTFQIPKNDNRNEEVWLGKSHDHIYEHIRQGHLVELVSPPFYIPKPHS